MIRSCSVREPILKILISNPNPVILNSFSSGCCLAAECLVSDRLVGDRLVGDSKCAQ